MSEVVSIHDTNPDPERLAAFLMGELCQVGYQPSILIAQMLASYSESGAGDREAYLELAASMQEMIDMLQHPARIWSELLPGGGGPNEPEFMLVRKKDWDDVNKDYSKRVDIGEVAENIVLPYGLTYHKDELVYDCPNGAEFFLDEHGRQWIKFIPLNGSDRGKEHMFLVNQTTDWLVRQS